MKFHYFNILFNFLKHQLMLPLTLFLTLKINLGHEGRHLCTWKRSEVVVGTVIQHHQPPWRSKLGHRYSLTKSFSINFFTFRFTKLMGLLQLIAIDCNWLQMFMNPETISFTTMTFELQFEVFKSLLMTQKLMSTSNKSFHFWFFWKS